MTTTELQLAARLAVVTEALQRALVREGEPHHIDDCAGADCEFHRDAQTLSLSPDAAVLRAKADAYEEAANAIPLAVASGPVTWLRDRAAHLRAKADRLPHAPADDMMERAVAAAKQAWATAWTGVKDAGLYGRAAGTAAVEMALEKALTAALEAALRVLAGDAP